MRSLEDQLATYAAYHRDARNIATHFIGIPLIVVSLLALLSPAGVGRGRAAVFASLRGGDRRGPLLPAAKSAPWRHDADVAAVPRVRRLGGVAVDGGVAEHRYRRLRHRLAVSVCRAFLGGRKPAFMDDVTSLIIGPLLGDHIHSKGAVPAMRMICSQSGTFRRKCAYYVQTA